MIINMILFYIGGLANSDDNKHDLVFCIGGLANSGDNGHALVLHRRSCKF